MRRVNRMHRILLVLILLLGFVSIGYAALQTTLNINGTTSIKRNNWDVHFENVRVIDGNVTPTQAATITSPTTVTFNVPLSKQGDFYTFEVDVINAGTIDAMISVVSNSLTAAQKKFITFDVSYKNGVIPQINVKDSLPAGAIRRLTVFVKYRDDVPVSDLPTDDQNLNLNFSIKYVQDDKTSNEFLSNASTLSGLSNLEGKNYNESSNIYKGQMYTFSHPDTAQVPATTDYRYIGNVPNNYIKFNNETWRIIGVFDGRIKIIRDESIGNMQWDDDINEWPTSTLATYLNSGDYWTNLPPTIQKKVETVTYYLGGRYWDETTIWGNGSDIYIWERGSEVYAGNSTYWVGKVGLMYPSDYAYSFANGVDDICFKDVGSVCKDSKPSSSWLYKIAYRQWTISHYASNNYTPLTLYSDGNISGIDVYNMCDVRPVIYLKSDTILTGIGASSNHYVIK